MADELTQEELRTMLINQLEGTIRSIRKCDTIKFELEYNVSTEEYTDDNGALCNRPDGNIRTTMDLRLFANPKAIDLYTPLYKHDCAKCVFLGRYTNQESKIVSDLYHCGSSESDLGGSVIARWSDKGPDYSSMPISIACRSSHPELVEALKRFTAIEESKKKIFCPKCGAEEIDASTPRTMYACGSSDYDQRPGSFKKGPRCKL